MENHGSYEKELQAQIEEWDAKIDQLKAKAKKVEAENEREFEKQLDNLIALQKDTHEKMQQLRNASDEAWDDVRQGVEASYTTLKKTFETAVSRFQ